MSKQRKTTFFKMSPNKWINGSTREEMTPSQRSVWVDFLALATINDPYGQIDFYHYTHLANKLNIKVKLLKSTIENAIRFDKIDFYEDGKNLKESQDIPNLSPKDTQRGRGKGVGGLPQRTIVILKWNQYQSEFLRQKSYGETKYRDKAPAEESEESSENTQNPDPKSVKKQHLEERRGEERR